MGYLKDTIRGVSWMGGLRASTRLIAFAKIAILARILLPEQFGLFGIATLVLAFLEIMTETGINVFLIQEKADLKKYNDTAFIVSIARGILITLLMLSLAPFVASFFSSPNATGLLYLISLVPFLRGFINPAVVKFQKELRFNKEFLLKFFIYFTDAIVAVAFAYATGEAASLVWGLIAGVFVEVLISHIFIRPRPKFNFEKAKFKRVIDRGKWVTVAGIFEYLFKEGDDIVVGRLLSTYSLGVYQVAYKISTLPITEVADVVIKVTFPVFVKITDDKKRLKQAFKKTLLGVSSLVIPVGVILFVFTEKIVLLLLGPNWLEAIPVIKMLSAFGIIRGITHAFYPLFLSLKKQEYVTAVTLAGILGLGISIFPLVSRMGIVGAGLAAIIGAAFAFPVAIYYAIKIFKE